MTEETQKQEEAATMVDAPTLPDGVYAIVELLGHQTIIGRVEEVTRFGAAMMQIEPIYAGKLLAPILQGGGSLYRFTQCSREVAARRAGVGGYLPSGILEANGIGRVALPPPSQYDDFDDVDGKGGF
jgi:hypothetical protein